MLCMVILPVNLKDPSNLYTFGNAICNIMKEESQFLLNIGLCNKTAAIVICIFACSCNILTIYKDYKQRHDQHRQ